jgi:hypothetical protein
MTPCPQCLGSDKYLFGNKLTTNDAHRQISAINPILGFYHDVVDVGDHRVGIQRKLSPGANS